MLGREPHPMHASAILHNGCLEGAGEKGARMRLTVRAALESVVSRTCAD